MKRTLHILTLLIISLVFSGAEVHAQSEDMPEDIVCASVLPCDANGQVLEGFRNSPCDFETICAWSYINELKAKVAELEDDLLLCEDSRSEANGDVARLKNRLRTLRSRAKSARF